MAISSQNKQTIGPVTQSKVRGKALVNALSSALNASPKPQVVETKRKKK